MYKQVGVFFDSRTLQVLKNVKQINITMTTEQTSNVYLLNARIRQTKLNTWVTSVNRTSLKYSD